MLQAEYHYIGFKRIKTLTTVIPSIQRRLAITSVVSLLILTSIATYAVVSSNLMLR